jgi:hypothetical protein
LFCFTGTVPYGMVLSTPLFANTLQTPMSLISHKKVIIKAYVFNNENKCEFQKVSAASEGAQIPCRAPLPGRFRFEALDGS